jgi:hypothetical protein
MSLVTAPPVILTDPGFLFWAPLATAIPTMAALASSYDLDVWSASWISLGATEDGSKFKYETTIEAVEVAEFFDPIKWSTTGRQGSFAFNLASYTLKNVQRVFNSGTGGIATVSGSGVTLSSSYTPPAPGAEVRAMIGWESLDHTVRLIAFQCINGGSVESAFAKAPAKAVLPCEFKFEVPASGVPWQMFGAGTVRLGT